MTPTINNSTIGNTTFDYNIRLLDIHDALISKCSFKGEIDGAVITGNLTKCLFEGLYDDIHIIGPLSDMTILVDIRPTSAYYVLDVNLPSKLILIESLSIDTTTVPRLAELPHKECFINVINPGNKLAFLVQLSTDDTTPSGVILMWSGNIDDIPKGYGICDGRTIGDKLMPDLSGRFIRMIDSGESTGLKNNSELVSNGLGTRTTYIQLLSYHLPVHTHSFNITADVSIDAYTGSASGNYSYAYDASAGTVHGGEGSEVDLHLVANDISSISVLIDHSHNGSLTNVLVTQNDDSSNYPNTKINVEPNAYALIFIMKL